jgi:hypothetical protein
MTADNTGCKRCGGNLVAYDDGDFICLQCGKVQYAKARPAGTSIQIDTEPVSKSILVTHTASPALPQPVRRRETTELPNAWVAPRSQRPRTVKTWYSPGAIKYTRNQIIWLLTNTELLKEGIWPRRDTGYTDAPRTSQVKFQRNAKFVNAVEIGAEVTRRLDACGRDGRLVLRYYIDGWEPFKMAELISAQGKRPMGEMAVWRRMNSALSYCHGEDMKEEPYQTWKKEGRR